MQTTKPRNGPPSSPNHSKNTKNRGSKSTERASPRNPVSEKKHTTKTFEMESQLVQLQEELKRAKDQLSSLEAQKKRAQQEAEETRKEISSLSDKLEESQQQLIELSDSEEARLHELRKISQERDRSWQSELDSLQKQHAADTVALSSAMNEIQRLKKQLDVTAESAHLEVQSLRIELSETLDLVAEMKHQLEDAKDSEAHAVEMVSDTQRQLKAAKEDAEAIRADSLEAKEGYNSLASELEQSKAQVNTLEMLVSQLQEDLAKKTRDHEDDEIDKIKTEIDSLKLEAEQLKSALEASEAMYQNEYIQSTLQIRSAYEAVESAKSESSVKEAALVEELNKAKETIEAMKSILRKISNENEELGVKIDENQASEKDLKSALLDKETQLQTLAEENEMLRAEIGDNGNEEALKKLDSLRAEKIGEQLYATQMVKEGLEAELRMLKVQADQWRKAAEAAAAMLSPDCDVKMVERSVCVETVGMKMDSPFSDTMDDDSPKKKNANMLKKIGGLWKKGQK